MQAKKADEGWLCDVCGKEAVVMFTQVDGFLVSAKCGWHASQVGASIIEIVVAWAVEQWNAKNPDNRIDLRSEK